MTIQNIPIKLSAAERMAWMRLMGTQPIPSSRDEITRQAGITFELRCKQSLTNIETLGMLTVAAETLQVFGGKLDTQTTSFLVRRPASLPVSFRTIEAHRLAGNEAPRSLPANEAWVNESCRSDRRHSPPPIADE